MSEERLSPREEFQAELRRLQPHTVLNLASLFEAEIAMLGNEITRLNGVASELTIDKSRLEQQVAVERQAGARARALVRELTKVIHNVASRLQTLHIAFSAAGVGARAPSLLNLLQQTLEYLDEATRLVARELQDEERRN